jgi:hypothetical protein
MNENTMMIYNFYNEYYGHNIDSLTVLVNYFREKKGRDSQLIFLAGDSSMDNKHWFNQASKSCNGYENILEPPHSKKDVCYWINKLLVDRDLGSRMTCINSAVEESSIGTRACATLQTHDKFIQNIITTNDILVVSVGGNDIALKPNMCTICNAGCLLYTQNAKSMKQYVCGEPFSCDDYCCGCSTGCLSNFIACPFGYGYFLHLFKTRAQAYISNLIAKTKPKKVLVCMIYYVDETETGSWADTSMKLLGYNKSPQDLQMLTRLVYENATRKMKFDGVETIAVPFFTTLDGKTSSDYAERVEPSSQGGAKLAQIIVDAIENGQAAMDRRYEDHCDNLRKRSETMSDRY